MKEMLRGKHVVFHLDNMPEVYGWEQGSIKCDSSASTVIKAVKVLAAYIGAFVHVVHVPRKSTELADLADTLSRESSSKGRVTEDLEELRSRGYSRTLEAWLKEPGKMKDFVYSMTKEIENRM